MQSLVMQTSDIFHTLEQSWQNALGVDFSAPYILKLKAFLQEETRSHKVFPPETCIFKSFATTPFHKVKVVIIGQDPYHGEGQAHGLCFSVNKGIAIPPSLRNIFKELQSDLGIFPPGHGNLYKWASQGVLLLNATLTVRANQAGSHQKKGWEQFTEKAISTLSQKSEGLVFLLWGNAARGKKHLIDTTRHHILEAAHPSPLSASRGFSGCRHFSRTNELLRASGKQEIDWRIE